MENRKDTPALDILLTIRELNLDHKDKELTRRESIYTSGITTVSPSMISGNILVNPTGTTLTIDGATIINATLKNCKISNCKISK